MWWALGVWEKWLGGVDTRWEEDNGRLLEGVPGVLREVREAVGRSLVGRGLSSPEVEVL